MNFSKRIFIAIPIIMVLLFGYPTASVTAVKNEQSQSSQKTGNITKAAPPQPLSVTSEKKSIQSKPSPTSRSLTGSKKTIAYCCEKGTVVMKKKDLKEIATNKTCELSRSTVQRFCGFCCKNNSIFPVTNGKEKQSCERGGNFYATKNQAEENCGWCCKEKKVFSVSSKEQCTKNEFHRTKSKAQKQCEPKKGFCNVKGKTLPHITEKRCSALRGLFFEKRALATTALLKDKRLVKNPLVVPSSPATKTAFTRLPHSADIGNKKPVLLPDLDVIYTSTNALCFMTGKVKNLGGPISVADHAAAKIHLSAGPGQISSKTKLTDIDPTGALRSPGGEITYTTELRITEPNQATLVWMDTADIGEPFAITESNESNNGDYAVLTCKTQLVWCCVPKKQDSMREGQVGQMSQGECEALRGTSHDSAAKANRACGIKMIPGLLPSTKQLDKNAVQKSQDNGPREIRGQMIPQGLQGKAPGTGIPTSLDEGISIFSPTRRNQFYQGETIEVQYTLSREIEAGDVFFSLKNSSTGATVDSLTIAYVPDETRLPGTLVLTLPESTPGGMYKITAEHSISDAYGESDSFFLANSASINFVRPERGEYVRPGTNLTMRFQLSRRVVPGTVTFNLHTIRSTTSLASATHSYHPPDDMDLSREYTAELPIPDGVSCDDCMISASHVQGMGTSSTFTIQNPTVEVTSPMSRDHWESCNGGTVRWTYHGDPETMPSPWEIEFLRDGSREFIYRSGCTNFADGYPPQRRCRERIVTPCLPTGSYTIRASAGGVSGVSGSPFRIGITDDWPMISISSPRNQSAYFRENPLPVTLFSTAAVDVEVEMRSTRGGHMEVFQVDDMVHHSRSFRIPDLFAEGQYNFIVRNRRNRDNYAHHYFFVTDEEVDFSIRNASTDTSGQLFAEVHVQSRPRVFSGSVSFHIETIRPHRSWFVTRHITGRPFPSSHWERVSLGDFDSSPGDSARYPYGIEYRVTIDGEDTTRESNEENNVTTARFLP